MQDLRNKMAQLSQRLETLDNSRANLSGTADDHQSKTVERSLSPVLIRNKGRNRQLSPVSRSYKKTLHVCYIFIIKIYFLFNL